MRKTHDLSLHKAAESGSDSF